MAKEKRENGKQDKPATTCTAKPTLQEPACLPRRSFSPRRQVKDPARLEWHEVTKMAHYYLSVDALSACNAQAGMTRPMQVREDEAPYGEKDQE